MRGNRIPVRLLVNLAAFYLVMSLTNADQSQNDHEHKKDGLSGMTSEEEHLQQHLDELKIEAPATSEEKEYRRFKMFYYHDFDENMKLDGLEVYVLIDHDQMFNQQVKNKGDTVLAGYVDQTFIDLDFNEDGYISYPEFRSANGRVDSTAS